MRDKTLPRESVESRLTQDSLLVSVEGGLGNLGARSLQGMLSGKEAPALAQQLAQVWRQLLHLQIDDLRFESAAGPIR